MRAQAIRIHAFGGPEELVLEEIEVPEPGPGEVRLNQTAIALHFADTLLRRGIYFIKPDLPSVVGLESAGVVESVGPGVTDVAPGDRVACRFGLGACTSVRVLPAAGVIKLPEGVDEKTAAAALVRVITVQYLVRQSYRVGPDDAVLVHAAAGGVGTILCQWAKHLGATVIGAVGSAPKVPVAKAAGADHVIDMASEDFAARCNEITGGEGVNVVYDSIGHDAYEGNVEVLAPTGYFLNYGHSSGPLPPIDAALLNKKSLFFAKLSMPHYMRTPEAVDAMVGESLDMLASGVLKAEINHTYPLAETAQAHRDLEARKTTGCVVLIP